jgi:hypothetical protein
MIKVLEYTWLFMSVLGLSAIACNLLKAGECSQMGLLGIFTFIAIVMYLYRRHLRIGMDRAKAE